METKEIVIKLNKSALEKRAAKVENEETRNYLLDRILPTMEEMRHKAAADKAAYNRLMTAHITASAAIPALAVVADVIAIKIALIALGTSTMAVNAYAHLRGFRRRWVACNETYCALERLLYCYFNGAGVFEDAEDADVLLVESCEGALR